MNKENSAPARLLPTTDENENGPPGAVTGSPYVWEHKFFGDFGRRLNLGTHGAGPDDVPCEHYVVDNTKGTYVSAQSHIIIAGASTAEIACQYSPTQSLGDMADLVVMPLRTANAVVPRVTTPILMPSDSKVKNLLLKLIARGGNGVLTPEMWNYIVTATSGRPPTVPGGTPEGDLPEDATWGSVILDLNVNGPLFQALGLGDGDDVETWPDEKGLHDFGTAAALLLPKYRSAGIAGSLACVEWDGANVYLSNTNNPTAGLGSYTYYFVVEDLDGGDGAYLWAGGLGDSFGYHFDAYDTQVQLANNNLFGSPSIIKSDDWGMGDRHIYRWTKNAGSASHQLFVDGVLKGSAGAAPQPNNNGLTYLMNALSGLGMTGRIGRVFAYNMKHDSPTNTGAVANGLTAPEIIIQAFYGTP
jgi:hypothetical protein